MLYLRLFTKGARVLGFEKLRELVGDFQQLNYAKGRPFTCFWRRGLHIVC